MVDAELREELEYHIDRQSAEFVARGMAPGDARELAAHQLGDLDELRRRCRHATPGFLEPLQNWSPAMSIRRVDFKVLLPALMLLGAGIGWLVATMTPPRYRSEAVMTAVPQQVFPEYVRDPVSATLAESFAAIQTSLLSRTRLEQLIKEFNLYAADRERGETMSNLIDRMRKDIGIEAGAGSTLTISYTAPTPELAMRVAERLADHVKSDSIREYEDRGARTLAFLVAQVDHLGVRLTEMGQRDSSGRPTDDPRVRIERETLESLYARALTNLEEARVQVELTRRQVGVNLVLLDAARLPERPSSPSRAYYVGFGALGGAILALLVATAHFTWRAWRTVRSKRVERIV